MYIQACQQLTSLSVKRLQHTAIDLVPVTKNGECCKDTHIKSSISINTYDKRAAAQQHFCDQRQDTLQVHPQSLI